MDIYLRFRELLADSCERARPVAEKEGELSGGFHGDVRVLIHGATRMVWLSADDNIGYYGHPEARRRDRDLGRTTVIPSPAAAGRGTSH